MRYLSNSAYVRNLGNMSICRLKTMLLRLKNNFMSIFLEKINML